MTTKTQKEIVTVEVPRVNLNGLAKQLDKLIKKAAKLKSGEVGYSIDPNFIKKTVVVNEITGEKAEVVYQKVTVYGDQPIIAGWAFVASLSNFEGVGNVVRAIPGETIPVKYQETETTLCEHCFTKRFRKEVYVVRNVDTAEYKQVGSTCLKDFTGHNNPTTVAKYAEFLISVKELVESADDFDGAFGPSQPERFDLLRFLTEVAREVRKYGWVSRGMAYDQMTTSTADRVMALRSDTSDNAKEERVTTEADAEIAEAAIEYGQSFEGSDQEFEHNLYVIASFGAISRKEIGFAAYLVQGYLKSVEKAKYLAKKEKIVAFDAAVAKKRMEAIVTVDMIRTVDGFYGPSLLVKFDLVQEDGSIVQLTTFGTGQDLYDLKEDKTYLIKFTVKGNEEYKGVPNTKVNRVKVLKEIEKETNG